MSVRDWILGSSGHTQATAVSGSARVGNWDGWRGLAILSVLCGHFYDIKWLWEDRMGVDVFFVLSGMLMSIILFEKRLSLRDFYIRRLSRIFPVLVVYVVIVYAFSFVQQEAFTATEFFSTLFFLRTYIPAEPSIWGTEVAIGHLWSLNVEEHAYLFLSVVSLLLINRKHIGWLLLALGVGTIVLSFRHYNLLNEEDFKLYFIRTESSIVFIFFSAGYGLLKRKHCWKLPPYVPLLCILAAVVCYAEALPMWLLFTLSPVFLAISVNHLNDLPALINKFLAFAPLRYIGLWSYSLYLWQQLFYMYSWAIPFGKPMGLLLTFIAGIASYYLLETPVRHLINSKWSANPVYRKGQAEP